MKHLKIGVIGFRGEPVDLQEAKETLNLAFNTIERESPGVKFIVLFDGLNLGVSTIAAPLAEARGWHTHSIFRIFNRSEWDKYGPVDAGGTVIAKFDRYGDVILELVDVLVRIGGGQKRREWAQKFKGNGGRTYEYDLSSS